MARNKVRLTINGLNDFNKSQKLKARLQLRSKSVVNLSLWNIQDHKMSDESSFSSDSGPTSPMLVGQRTSSEEESRETTEESRETTEESRETAEESREPAEESRETAEESRETTEESTSLDKSRSFDSIVLPLKNFPTDSGEKFSWDLFFSESAAHYENDDPVWKRIKNPKPLIEQREESKENSSTHSTNKVLITEGVMNRYSSISKNIKKRLRWDQICPEKAKNQLIQPPKKTCENNNQVSPIFDKTFRTGDFPFKIPRIPSSALKTTPMGDVQRTDLGNKNQRTYSCLRNYDNLFPIVESTYNRRADILQGTERGWRYERYEKNKVKRVGWWTKNAQSLNIPALNNFLKCEGQRGDSRPYNVGQDAVVPSNSPNIIKSSNVNCITLQNSLLEANRVQIFKRPNENSVVPGDVRLQTAPILQNQVPNEKSWQNVSTCNPPTTELTAVSQVFPVEETAVNHYSLNAGNFQLALQSAFAEKFHSVDIPQSFPDKTPSEFTQNKTLTDLPVSDETPSKGSESLSNIAENVQIASSQDEIAQPVNSIQESSNVSDNLANNDTSQINQNPVQLRKIRKQRRRFGQYSLSKKKKPKPIIREKTDTDFRPMSKETKLIVMDELISELTPEKPHNLQGTPIRVKRTYRKKAQSEKNLSSVSDTPKNTSVRYVTRSISKNNQPVTKVTMTSEEIAQKLRLAHEPTSIGHVNDIKSVENAAHNNEGTSKMTIDEGPLSTVSHLNEKQSISDAGKSVGTDDSAGEPSNSNSAHKDNINIRITKISPEKSGKQTGESYDFQIVSSHKTVDTNKNPFSASSQNATLNIRPQETARYSTRSSVKEKTLERVNNTEDEVIPSTSDQHGPIQDYSMSINENSDENSLSDCSNCSSNKKMTSVESFSPDYPYCLSDMEMADSNFYTTPVINNKSNNSVKKSSKLSTKQLYDEIFSKLETAYNKRTSLKAKSPGLKNNHHVFQKLNVEKITLLRTPLTSELKVLFTYDFKSILSRTKTSTNTKHAFFNHEGEDVLKILMTPLWMKNLKNVVSYEKKKLEEYKMGKKAQSFVQKMCDSLITTGKCDNYLCRKDHEMGKNFCLPDGSLWQTSYFFLSKASNPHLEFYSSVLNWLGDKKSLGKIFVLAEIFYNLHEPSSQEKFQLWDHVVKGIMKCGMSDWEAMLCLVSYFHDDDNPAMSWNFMKTCLKIHKKSIEVYWKIFMNLASLGFSLKSSSIVYLVEIFTLSYTFQSQESGFLLAYQVQTLDLAMVEKNFITLKKFDKILGGFLRKISSSEDTSTAVERIRNMADLGQLLEKTFPSKVLPKLLLCNLRKKSVRFMRHLSKFLLKNKMKKGLEAVGQTCLSLIAEFKERDKHKRAAKMLKMINKKFKHSGLKPLNETDETD